MTIQLPEGYSDKFSPFYIPEELRSHYENLKPVGGRELGKVMESFARTITKSRVTQGADSREYWEEVDNILSESDTKSALHIHYMQNAAVKYEQHLKYEERKAWNLEQSRCPHCDTLTLHTPGNPVARRSTRLLRPQVIEQPGDLTSCLKCYLAVMDAKYALAVSEKVGKETRKQIAERILSSL